LPLDSYIPAFEAAPPKVYGAPPAPPHRPLRLALALAIAAVTTVAALIPFGRFEVTPRRSIAILPFASSGGLQGEEYFSDGLARQMANQLGRSGRLRVAAYRPASQFRFGDDVRRIGDRLQVDLVLEGTVNFRDDRVAVAIRLFDTHTGGQIWAREFDSPAVQTLELQEEISNSVSSGLRVADGGIAAAPGWSHNREALDLYLQAHNLFASRKPENLWKSVELYRAAVQKDPRFALAYIGLAKDYVVLGTNEDQDLSQTRPLAQQAVARALAIDPNLPDALLTEAATADYRDFASLERSYRAAVAANPDNVDAHHWWGLNLLAAGRFTEAEAEMRRAQSLDPQSEYIRIHIGTVYYCSRRYQDTIDQERMVLALDPHQPRALALEARGYEGIGRYHEAAAILENLLKTTRSPNAMADLGHVYAAAGKTDQARHMLEALSKMAKTRHVSPHYLALIQTGLGNKNEAIALLDLSLEQHDAPLALLKVDPRWDPLRGDPRFQQVLRGLCVGK